MEPIRTCVIGIGMAGSKHLKRLLALEQFKVVGLAEKKLLHMNGYPQVLEAQKAGAQAFERYETMFDKVSAEAVFICTPHHLHLPMCKAALEHGLYVFVEKPPAPTVDGCNKLLALEDEQRWQHPFPVTVGFHHVGHANALWLKQWIANGGLGEIGDIMAIMPGHRPDSYYERAPWVGKMKVDGQWCLDGVLMNQMIHNINQAMLFASTRPMPDVMGLTLHSMKAALYRVHDTHALEADDLAIFRCQLGHTNFFCVATTALLGHGRPTIEIIGERGRAVYDGRVLIWPHQPRNKSFVYDRSDEEDYLYRNFADVVRHGATPLSPLEQAVKSVAVVEAAFKAVDYKVKKVKERNITSLRGLLYESGQYRCLFSELPDYPYWA